MRPLRHRTWADDVDADQANVFVPGLIGAGVLASIAFAVADVLQRLRGDAQARRERELIAWFVTHDVVRSIHRDHELDPTVGLRSRVTYVVWALVFLGIGFYGLVGSFWNYVNPVDEGWVEGIAWVWALSNVAIAALMTVGTVLAFIAWRYPHVPAWARRFLARTPIGVASDARSLRLDGKRGE